MLLRMFLFIVLSSSALSCLAEVQEVKVGVLAFRGAEKAWQRWYPSINYLSETITDSRFKLIPMSLTQLDNAVIEQKIDFVITNAGQYVRVGSKHGMSWLATLKSRRHNGSNHVIGSTLVVKASSSYWNISDLQGRTLGAVDPLAFGGFQVYWGELSKQAIDPKGYFSEINFSRFPVDVLMYWVRDQTVDGAIVPTCLMEKMHEEGLIDIQNYRVLDKKQHQNFNCQSSSQLYPNWSFAKLRKTSPVLAEKVAKALLSMEPDSNSAIMAGSLGWTAPVSTYDIHQLYQRLNIHPWQANWWQQAWRWMLMNWQWGVIVLSLIFISLMHHLWVQLLVNRRTHELQELNVELLQQQQQLEHAQRVAILGELSSELAHELNQPLAAINSYAEGGIVRLRKGQDNHDQINLLDKISIEAQRSAKIIRRIRRFAKNQKPVKQLTDFVQLIHETLILLQIELKKSNTELFLELPKESVKLMIDAIEIQQVLINLIRNSIEALSNVEGPRQVRLQVQAENGKKIQVKIIDNGPGIKASISEQLFLPFFSTKKQGMGLGMSICKRIIESHHGKIWFEENPTGGSIFNFTLSGNSDD